MYNTGKKYRLKMSVSIDYVFNLTSTDHERIVKREGISSWI